MRQPLDPTSAEASAPAASDLAKPNGRAMRPDPRAVERPAWADAIDNPYLHGIHGPTVYETTAHALPVEGELPADLCGAYMRNGPNAVLPPRGLYHWFDGDGMVHAVFFRDGVASYRSRLVRTTGLAAELRAGHALWAGVMGPYPLDAPPPRIKDTANTDLVFHNGRVLATWYLCGEPYRLDPITLDTLGVEDFGGKRTTRVSAHPKVDPRTGELVWFTIDEEPPYMTYGVVSADGELVHQAPIDLPGARDPHDITLTERYSILHDFPYFHDPAILRSSGYRIARFHRNLPSRFGVIPRRGSTGDVRWFEFEPGYVLHMVNAWEEGDWITMDGCFQPDPTIQRRPEEGELASMLGYLRIRAHLHRWRMNLRTGEAKEEALDDLNVEFCLPDTELYGAKTRYSYHQHLPDAYHTVRFAGLAKYDHATGERTLFDYGDGVCGAESPFARRPSAHCEDDGYVVTLITREDAPTSECWVFDAREIERGPLARVMLPARVPSGFHAIWVPGERIFSDA
jgi:carotenoid cleavage dioxygenase